MRAVHRHRSIAGVLLASALVAVAIAGPPIVGESVRPIVEIRHNVLAIDREFERIALRSGGAPGPAFAIVVDRSHASGFKPPRWGD